MKTKAKAHAIGAFAPRAREPNHAIACRARARARCDPLDLLRVCLSSRRSSQVSSSLVSSQATYGGRHLKVGRADVKVCARAREKVTQSESDTHLRKLDCRRRRRRR